MIEALKSSDFWQGLLWVWLIALFAANAVYLVIAIVKQVRRPKSTAPIIRTIVDWDATEDGIELTMECGHEAVIRFPDRMRCEHCSKEVAELEKMAGRK